LNATLAAKAAFLVTTKWAGRVEPVERIRPDNTGTNFVCHCEDPATLLRPDSSAETIRSVVGFLNCFIGGSKRENTEHWTKDFLASDPVRLGHAREYRWGEPETLLWDLAVRAPTLGTFILATLGQVNDPVELLTRVDRANVGVLI